MSHSAVILSAGNSLRMERPKALLKTKNKITFIEHLVNLYNQVNCQNVIIVAQDNLIKELGKLQLNAEIISNTFPEKGRMYSIQLASYHVPERNHCFIQNVDNPISNSEILNTLLLSKDKAEIIFPQFLEKKGHPILISGKVVNAIKTQANAEIEKLNLFLRKYSNYGVNVQSASVLLNINTSNDYENYINRNPAGNFS